MTAIENKGADAFGDLHRAFASFREANDERLGQTLVPCEEPEHVAAHAQIVG
jgi:hypothetical protein